MPLRRLLTQRQFCGCQLVLPIHIGMHLVGNVFPISPLVVPVRIGMNLVGNVFPISPLALSLLIGMNLVGNVFPLCFPIAFSGSIIIFAWNVANPTDDNSL
jgi:hypothetical protein